MATSLQWADISQAPRSATAQQQVPLPRELYIESTSRCNEHCDQCPRTHLGREADPACRQTLAVKLRGKLAYHGRTLQIAV